MTSDNTAAVPTIRARTFQYAFVASHASCQRPRAAQADSGIGANSTAMPARNSQKDFIRGGWWPVLISGMRAFPCVGRPQAASHSPLLGIHASACAFTNERNIP